MPIKYFPFSDLYASLSSSAYTKSHLEFAKCISKLAPKKIEVDFLFTSLNLRFGYLF